MVKTTGCVMYHCGSSPTEKSFCDSKMVEFELYNLDKKVKVNKLLLASNNEQVV